MGRMSVASRDRKPTAVEIVVRIIGTPTSRSVDTTRSTGSGSTTTTSWKWVTKWRPSAEPITSTKIGTITVTMSISRPSPARSPNVHNEPSSAGTTASTLRRRSPTFA